MCVRCRKGITAFNDDHLQGQQNMHFTGYIRIAVLTYCSLGDSAPDVLALGQAPSPGSFQAYERRSTQQRRYMQWYGTCGMSRWNPTGWRDRGLLCADRRRESAGS